MASNKIVINSLISVFVLATLLVFQNCSVDSISADSGNTPVTPDNATTSNNEDEKNLATTPDDNDGGRVIEPTPICYTIENLETYTSSREAYLSLEISLIGEINSPTDGHKIAKMNFNRANLTANFINEPQAFNQIEPAYANIDLQSATFLIPNAIYNSPDLINVTAIFYLKNETVVTLPLELCSPKVVITPVE